MKKTILYSALCFSTYSGIAQPNYDNHIRIIPGSKNSVAKRLEFLSDVDSAWDKWQQRGYYFGFNPTLTPMYTTVNGILSTPYMIQVRGNEQERNKKRWGYHVFEGYARDDKSRITMLVNKHVEAGRAVAEMYYYGTKYDHSDSAYNWFRIGSDVRQHSFLFGRDKAIFYGSLQLTNAFTLGNIGKADMSSNTQEIEAEKEFSEDAKRVNFIELKDSGDGTMFYDKDNHIVAIKVQGKWMKLVVEALPEKIKYPF